MTSFEQQSAARQSTAKQSTARQVQAVRNVRSELIQDLDPEDLVPVLKCLTVDDECRIEARKKSDGRTRSARLFLDIIVKRENWYSDLLQALRNDHVKCGFLADVIEKEYIELADCKFECNMPVEQMTEETDGKAEEINIQGDTSTTLPCMVANFTSREETINNILTWFWESGSPLCLLTGSGGFGKTSVAIAGGHKIVERYSSCVKFLPLQNIKSTEFIISCLLTQFGQSVAVVVESTVCHQANDSLNFTTSILLDRFINFLKRLKSKTLIILDNIEQILQCTSDPKTKEEFLHVLHAIATANTKLKILCTSRVLLHFPDVNAQVLDVKPFDTPSAQSYMSKMIPNAIHDKVMTSLLKSCGNAPLALNLIAHQLKSGFYTAEELAEDLETNTMAVLSSSSLSQTAQMETCIAASYNRLSLPDQAAFKGLVVFPSSFDRMAAFAVLGRDAGRKALVNLLSCSMLARDTDTQRYSMHPLLQCFVKTKIQEGELDKYKELFNAHYIERLLQMSECYSSPDFLKAISEYNQEVLNISAMLSAYRNHHKTMYSKYASLADKAVAVFLRTIAVDDGYINFLTEIIDFAGLKNDLKNFSEANCCKGYLKMLQGYHHEAKIMLETALRVYNTIEADCNDEWDRIFCRCLIIQLGVKSGEKPMEDLITLENDFNATLSNLEEQKISQIWQGVVINHLGMLNSSLSQSQNAKQFYEMCFEAMSWDISNHPWAANLFNNIGNILLRDISNESKAMALYEKAMSLSATGGFDDVLFFGCAGNLMVAYLQQEKWTKAISIHQRAEELVKFNVRITPATEARIKRIRYLGNKAVIRKSACFGSDDTSRACD